MRYLRINFGKEFKQNWNQREIKIQLFVWFGHKYTHI